MSQLLGCLATGTGIVRQDKGDFSIVAAESREAYKRVCPAIDADGAQVSIVNPA